jgi:FimV-like protein
MLPARLTLVVAAVVLFLSPTVGSAKDLWELPWIEVRSPHFVIVSALPEVRTVNLARDLENFRVAVQIITNIGRFEERIPTKVYVLPHTVDKLGFKNGFIGYFMPRMRANYVAVAPVTGASLDDTLKHEYVHFLVHNRDALSYPPWFDEGFAELLSTLSVRRDVIEYGKASSVRMDWLRNAPWMKFAKLIEMRNVSGLGPSDSAMFYAQSWLLMHYLMNGRPDRKCDVDNNAYLRAVEAGTKPTVAFEQAFGMPVSGIRHSLIKYATGRDFAYFRTRLAQPLVDASPLAQLVSPDSIAAQLGELSLQLGQEDEAKRYWDAAIALNPNSATALVGLGDLDKFAGRFEAAPAYYERAIAAEPHNAYPELDYAEYFLTRAETAKDRAEVTVQLTEARRHLARSYTLDPDDPETLAMNGSTYLFPGESIDKALQSLNAAHEMLPSQADIKLLLARAYIQSGDQVNATRLLRALVAWSHDDNGEQANKLLQQLVGVEPKDDAADAESTADE